MTNKFAAEIEEKVYELPFVRRCAALAKDKRIVLFVSLRGAVDREEALKKIQEFVKISFKDLPVPDRIVLKDSLPINALGKLDRRKLLEES